MPHLPHAHHEKSKHDSSNETKIKEKQNEIVPDSNSNIAKSMTHHNQTKKLTTWFLTHASNALFSALSAKIKDEIEMEYGWLERANLLWKMLEQMYGSSNSKKSSSSAPENISSSSTLFD
jgi:hypothetical protein